MSNHKANQRENMSTNTSFFDKPAVFFRKTTQPQRHPKHTRRGGRRWHRKRKRTPKSEKIHTPHHEEEPSQQIKNLV